MKPTTLIEGINTDFFKALNRFKAKNTPVKIYVYVESFDDIPFWKSVLHQFERKDFKFEVMTVSGYCKSSVLEFSEKVGKYLILCVDSDLDYLVQGNTKVSKLILDNEFIFHTYTYSIENYKCYSKSLPVVIAQATKYDNINISIPDILTEYSKAVYELFLWKVFFRKNDDFKTFTVEHFCELVKFNDQVDILDSCRSAINEVKARVEGKLEQLRTDFKDKIPEVTSLAAELNKLDVYPDNTYLFIKGHTILDDVVLKILNPLVKHFCSLRKAEIMADNSIPQAERIERRRHYVNSCTHIRDVLNYNVNHRDNVLYGKIVEDLNAFVLNYHPN